MFQFRNMLVGAIASAVLAAMAAPARAQSVMLKPKHTAGQKQYIEQHTEVTQNIRGGMMPGEGMEIKVDRIYGLWKQVESASDDGVKVTMTFDRAMQKVDSPMMEAAFDSDAPGGDDESQAIADSLNAMIGGKFKLDIGNDGEVKKCTGMGEILDKVEDAGTGSPFTMQLRNELTDERARVTYGEQLYLMYPNKEVKVGDTWKKVHRDTIPQVGKTVSHYEYKLDRISEENGHKVAVITYTNDVEKDNSGKPAGEMPGMSTKLKGSFTGTVTFDIDRGEVIRSESKGTSKVEMIQSGGDKADKDKDEDAGGKKAGKDKKDDDDGDKAPDRGMKVDVKVHQTYTVLSDAERQKQKTEAAARQAEIKKKAEADKAKAKKPEKPAKKDKDDDDE